MSASSTGGCSGKGVTGVRWPAGSQLERCSVGPGLGSSEMCSGGRVGWLKVAVGEDGVGSAATG